MALGDATLALVRATWPAGDPRRGAAEDAVREALEGHAHVGRARHLSLCRDATTWAGARRVVTQSPELFLRRGIAADVNGADVPRVRAIAASLEAEIAAAP